MQESAQLKALKKRAWKGDQRAAVEYGKILFHKGGSYLELGYQYFCTAAAAGLEEGLAAKVGAERLCPTLANSDEQLVELQQRLKLRLEE